jgi:putative heme-binding domain-containing protein
MKTFVTEGVVRPTCGCEFVSSRHFPDDTQGDYLFNNCITFHGVKRYQVLDDGSGFKTKEKEPLLVSGDTNFRPVDLTFGPDGALYVCDWFNPLIGHMQFSIRDPNRDHYHGRIWRITAKDRPLVTPPAIAGRPLPEVLDVLKVYEDRTRARARTHLRTFPKQEVAEALKLWVHKLNPGDSEYEHHLLEALWAYQTTHNVEPELLKRLLRSRDYRARAAATHVLRVWRDQIYDALPLLRVQVNDEHPRVRLEAVVALSHFRTPEAAEVALEALKRPTDYYLDYALKETMATLEPYWKPHVAAGKPFAAGNPAGLNYVLANVGTSDLAGMARSEPVYLALLAREGVPPQFRKEALEGLAKLHQTTPLAELLAALGRHDQGGRHGHAAHELGQLLLEQPPADLAGARGRLAELAAGAKEPATRAAAYVGLALADGSLDRVWDEAAKSAATLRDLVEAVPLIPDAKLRAAAYPRVRPLLDGLPPSLAGPSAPGQGAPRGRYVRIELPGINKTLTLAEVQVFSKGQNIALRGQARQSSTAHGGEARRAIDGNTSGVYADGGQTHTKEQELNPWWEVDLLVERPIDAVVVWNRTESGGQFASRLGGFTLKVLDAHRHETFVKTGIPAPADHARFDLKVDPAEDVRRAAVRAVARIDGHEAEAFTLLARLVQAGDLREDAVRALRGIPRQHWPAEQVRPLLDSLLAAVGGLSANERTEPFALDALQFAGELAGQLPAAEAARVRERLGELGVNVILIRTVPHAMVYDRPRIFVEAGKPVVIVIENTDIQPHNLIVVAPGALAEVGAAAERLAGDPDAPARQFIPKHPKVLHASRMLQPRESDRLQFTAPARPGEYPYLCTFPGHWRVMNGTMVVVPKLSDIPLAERSPATTPELKVRPFVRNWTAAELLPELPNVTHGRSFERGKELFAAASCVQCHKIAGEGGLVGPDLSELPKKLADKQFTLADVLREVMEPSKVINEKFKTTLIETKRGEVLTGIIIHGDDRAVQIVTGPLVKPREIPLADIEERKESRLSLMPEGLLVTLTKDEILDLLAYITSGGNPKSPAFAK